MAAPVPQLELLTDTPAAPEPPRLRTRRVAVFAGVFGLCLSIGETINFSRAPVYRSSASLLTVAPPAVDQTTLTTQLDVQHVAIQRQLLLGQPLLEQTLDRLRELGETERLGLVEVGDLRDLLAVVPVPSTHLVDVQAEGADPKALPRMVDAWIESYLVFREEAIRNEVGDTLDALREQYREIELRLEAKRSELEVFRERHEILSQGRTENEAHARLQGLNQSMNRAREREVDARSRMTAIEAALDRGEAVVPEAEQPALLQLEQRAQELRERLGEFEKRFTRNYMLVEKDYEILPAQLKEVEDAIRRKQDQGGRLELGLARQELAAATEAVAELERQLQGHKGEAAEFAARFAEYEAISKDLEGLEEIHRGTEQRLVQIETRSLEKYPQVKVVDWASTPTEPLRPSYLRDALLVLAGSFGLGILAVWLSEYLGRSGAPEPRGRGLAGIRIFSSAPPGLPQPLQAAPASLPGGGAPALSGPGLRELLFHEVDALWRTADAGQRRLIGLLLSGLSPDETLRARRQDLDPETHVLRVGDGAREIALAPVLARVVRETEDPGHPDEQEAGLRLLAHDTGLPFPDQVSAQTLRHTYLLFLVRQGVRLAELPNRIGPMSPRELMAYAPYSPVGPGRPLSEVDTTYPVLTRPV